MIIRDKLWKFDIISSFDISIPRTPETCVFELTLALFEQILVVCVSFLYHLIRAHLREVVTSSNIISRAWSFIISIRPLWLGLMPTGSCGWEFVDISATLDLEMITSLSWNSILIIIDSIQFLRLIFGTAIHSKGRVIPNFLVKASIIWLRLNLWLVRET